MALHNVSSSVLLFITSPFFYFVSTWSNLVTAGIIVVFLLNARSWPFAWHLRVFKPAIPLKMKHLLVQFGLKSRLETMKMVSPIGANPFDYQVTYTSRAYFDDCDFHFHMSNSAYAKLLDAAIMKTVLHSFAPFFSSGGWMPLTATNFYFHKQIPLLVKYEIRVRIATWDQKWIYFVSEFITKGVDSVVAIPDRLLYASNSDSASADASGDDASRSAYSKPKSAANAVAISKLCFKIGRITVPPVLVLAASGFCTPQKGTKGRPSYCHNNPPPHYQKVTDMLTSLESDSDVRRFLTHGWREFPQKDRWWDEVFSGLEDRRKEGLQYTSQLVDAINNLEKLCC